MPLSLKHLYAMTFDNVTIRYFQVLLHMIFMSMGKQARHRCTGAGAVMLPKDYAKTD
jgi:hypothetical protein